VLDETFILKLKLLEKLRDSSELLLRDVSWSLGIPVETAKSIAENLARNYIITVTDTRVKWSVADNPSTLKPWGWKLVHEIVLGTTMEYARSCGLWTAVVAEYQLMGRGRAGKKWFGNLGGLWATLRRPVFHEKAELASLAIPLIIVNVLERVCSVKAKIKWPNDIVYGDEKLAGVLITGEAQGDRLVLDIGIGINVNNEPPIPGSTSLKRILGRKIPRNSILSPIIGWVTRIEKLLDEPDELIGRFRENLATLNRRVRVVTAEGVLEGVAVDVNEMGELVVRVDGEEKNFSIEDVLELRHLD